MTLMSWSTRIGHCHPSPRQPARAGQVGLTDGSTPIRSQHSSFVKSAPLLRGIQEFPQYVGLAGDGAKGVRSDLGCLDHQSEHVAHTADGCAGMP